MKERILPIDISAQHIMMRNLLDNFPADINVAIDISKDRVLEKKYPTFSSILICGLGGSGIGGKLVANWCADELEVPVNFCMDYEIPNFVNTTTLVIACSYSGNTEEVLIATHAAHIKGASIIAITTGGKLAAFCKENDYEHSLIPGGNPPRTQLSFIIVQLTHIFAQLHLISSSILEDFAQASKTLLLNKAAIIAKAKEVAALIQGKQVIIYSDTKNEAIAIRARQQFNENAKILCSHHVIPEMNHNEIVGWTNGSDQHAVLYIHTGDAHPQNKKRFHFSKAVIDTKTQHCLELSTRHGSTIERSLYLIHILDWSSYFLAEANDMDPMQVTIIDQLKASL